MISDTQFELLHTLVDISNTKSTKDSDSILHSLCTTLHDQPKLLEHALEILDNDGKYKPVRQFTDPSQRRFFVVRGAQGQDYICFEQYCSCQSFSQLSRSCNTRVLCKHMLAVHIACAMHGTDDHSISSEEFATTMLDCTSSIHTG